jgi:hypothetical protein
LDAIGFRAGGANLRVERNYVEGVGGGIALWALSGEQVDLTGKVKNLAIECFICASAGKLKDKPVLAVGGSSHHRA